MDCSRDCGGVCVFVVDEVNDSPTNSRLAELEGFQAADTKTAKVKYPWPFLFAPTGIALKSLLGENEDRETISERNHMDTREELATARQLREELAAAQGVLEKLAPYCKTVPEMVGMIELALGNPGQLLLLGQVILGKQS